MASFFKKFLRNKSSSVKQPIKSDADKTQPSSPVQTGQTDEIPHIAPFEEIHLEVPQFIVGVAQSVGVQRDHNEDALYSLTTNLIFGERNLTFGLYMIADGMGGHENGEIASSLAVRTLSSHVLTNLYLPLLASLDGSIQLSIQEIMLAGIVSAHQVIKKVAAGSGTTMTAGLILGDQLTIGHVGDSRAYLVKSGGTIQLLTHDHSLVKRLQEIGQISAAQASIHPQRNVLYRALGQGEPFEPDIASFHLQPGDQLVICSDGLWGVVPENVLANIVHSTSEPHHACQLLTQSANSAGGPDNISVIIVQIPV